MGGAEHSLLDILEETSRRAEVFLVTSEPGILVDRAQALGALVSIVPCDRSVNAVRRGRLIASLLTHLPALFSFLRYVLHVRALINEIRPQLIHANVPKSHCTLFLLARLGFAGRCCFHVREIFDRGSVPFRLYTLLFPKRKGFIISISKAVHAMLPPVLQQASRVIYNGVEIPQFPEKQAVRNGAPRFIYLGRVVPWKGCHLLLEAFSKLGQNRGTLDIIGDTMYWDQSYRKELEAVITRSGLAEGTCRLLPHTEHPLEALCDHDVFCSASENEPFGRVVAEAMGCGLPVVGFATGGLPELVVHGVTGILVPKGDCAAMTSAMREFIDKPELIRTMGDAARKRAETLFDKKKQVKNIVDVLIEEAGFAAGESAATQRATSLLT